MTDRTQTGLGPDEVIGMDITAAAEQLGISNDAVRKRLARGQLPGVKREGRWYVLLNGVDGSTGPDRTADWLERENAWLRSRLEAAEVERAEPRRLLAGALQQIQQLPAPREQPSQDAAPAEAPIEAQPPAQNERSELHKLAHELERRRPWWWLPTWTGRKRGKEKP